MKEENGREHPDHPEQDEEHQAAETDGKARLQQQLIEIDNRQPVVAAAGQTSFATQLHQHAFTVGFVRHHLEAAIDLLAVGGVAVDKQVDAFGKHRRREADEEVEQIDRIEVGHGRQSCFEGSK